MRLSSFVSLLLVLLVCVSCGKSDTITPGPIVPPVTDTIPIIDTTLHTDTTHVPDTTAKHEYSFLALGDSYTIGQSVASYERFPAQTVQLLRLDNVLIADPLYIATTGWTTINLMQAINATQLSPGYDVVTLLIGVNDQYQRRDTTGYAANFEALLLRSIYLAGNKKDHVFVLSIPDYSATPFVPEANKAFVRMQIDQFNAINLRITLQYGVSYTDITPSTRLAATDNTLIAYDNLHPSGKEYKVWADSLAPKIKAVLH